MKYSVVPWYLLLTTWYLLHELLTTYNSLFTTYSLLLLLLTTYPAGSTLTFLLAAPGETQFYLARAGDTTYR